MKRKKYKLTIDGCARPIKIELSGAIKDKAGCKKVEEILTALEKLLKKHHLTIGQIDEISAPVFCDRGSYTGHRAGIAIVNACNLALGRKKVLVPSYRQKPKIG